METAVAVNIELQAFPPLLPKQNFQRHFAIKGKRNMLKTSCASRGGFL